MKKALESSYSDSGSPECQFSFKVILKSKLEKKTEKQVHF